MTNRKPKFKCPHCGAEIRRLVQHINQKHKDKIIVD